ncbi:hypothetical protein ACF05T_28000 [Streptomyces lateritius]|uniref:ATP-binding protein n=1 Tax=Streptomyces lateritius TaxID=67313 RepID=A0ABW6YJ71_9ACTN
MATTTPIRQAMARITTTVVLTTGVLALGVASAHAAEAPGAPLAPAGTADLGGLLGTVTGLLGGVTSGSAISGPDGLLPSGILGATP